MTDDAALDELRFLTRALRAHLEWQVVSGATGLERAPREAPAAAAAGPAVASTLQATPMISSAATAPASAVAVAPVIAAAAVGSPGTELEFAL